MKRNKRHKVKTEKKDASYSRENEEHDLAYYIHDRVELMHQVFSVLKYKDLKAMAPKSVRNLPIGDLQELCTEELLGISSKRLLATLDGCEPPSDTESSSASPSPEQLETISLDSISSDEEILSQSSKKKKHKHRRNLKSKNKEKGKDKSKEPKADESTEVSQASRAGLTVLELLELQARARAIRAQLQNEQAKKQEEAAAAAGSDDDDEVEIKEEAPDVVEISSGDEKPDINLLQAAVQKSPKAKEVAKPKDTQKENSKKTKKTKEPTKAKDATKTKETIKQIEKPTEPAKDTQKQTEAENKNDTEKAVTTKRINDLIITVPQPKSTRKIKLNRNKVTVTSTIPEIIPVDNRTASENPTVETHKEPTSDKKKKKKIKKKKNLEKEGSDHDEITLQLSDTEKMDLLEDLDEKNYQRVSSGSSDSESSSSDSEADTSKESVENETGLNKSYDKESNKIESSEVTNVAEKIPSNDHEASSTDAENEKSVDENATNTFIESDKDKIRSANSEEIEKESTSQCDFEESPGEMSANIDTIVAEAEVTKENENLEATLQSNEDEVIIEIDVDKQETEQNVEIKNKIESTKKVQKEKEEQSPLEKDIQIEIDTETNKTQIQNVENEEALNMMEINKIDDIPLVSDGTNTTEQENKVEKESKNEREISEGELSDRDSSEVEAYEVQPEVVCISDDEKQKKKKKKKDKKAKKEKKSKKSKQDFREGADENFYKDAKIIDRESSQKDDNSAAIDLTDDDVYEILELSDDSSCYEVEGTCLSKEPTAEEIAALSARIDEIKKEDIDQTNLNTPVEKNSPHTKSDASDTEIEQISWKDRYLGSKKVKRVLTTANILNALRKKNKDLKKKMADVKRLEMESQEDKVLQEPTIVNAQRMEIELQEEKVLVEGSIEHYQTLQGSSKYVNPVPESTEEITEEVSKEDKEREIGEDGVTREMKKDAKQLLKMYRKLMKNKKIKLREKKKKRKEKKKEDAVPVTADLV